jgi:large subunit ribosomal protein L4
MAIKKLIIIDDFSVSSFKTKEFSNILNGVDLLNRKTTILIDKPSDNMFLGCQNLKNIYLSRASHASAGDLLDCDVLVLDKNAAEYYNDTLKK